LVWLDSYSHPAGNVWMPPAIRKIAREMRLGNPDSDLGVFCLEPPRSAPPSLSLPGTQPGTNTGGAAK
ncbi:MAG TPA: hypothetical protein VG297_11330, partial [Bryobacteraceae bacterium]|nr:hypothetical protein [Bryobacteraceae bacterium]